MGEKEKKISINDYSHAACIDCCESLPKNRNMNFRRRARFEALLKLKHLPNGLKFTARF